MFETRFVAILSTRVFGNIVFSVVCSDKATTKWLYFMQIIEGLFIWCRIGSTAGAASFSIKLDFQHFLSDFQKNIELDW